MSKAAPTGLFVIILLIALSVAAAAEQSDVPLRGQVVDANGQPVEGVAVHTLFMQVPVTAVRRSATSITSADGTFEIQRPAVPAIVFVRTKDSASGCLLRVDEKQTDVVLHLQPLATVRGKIVDDAKSPVAEVDVVCSFAFPVSNGYSVGSNTGAKTAADGVFTIHGLFPGQEYKVQQFNRTDPPLTDLKTIKPEKAETLELGDIQISHTNWLTGKVIDPGPVDPREQAKGHALVLADYNSESGSYQSLSPRVTTTAADGSFKMRRADTSIIVEAITADGKMAGIARVAADDSECTIRVGLLATATGRITERGGKPVSVGCIRYSIRIPENRTPQSGFRQFAGSVAMLDADGKFKLTGLVPGEEYSLDYVYRAQWQNNHSQILSTFVAPSAASFQLNDIAFRPSEPLPHSPRPEGQQLERALRRQKKMSDFLAQSAVGTTFDIIVQQSNGHNFDSSIPAALASWMLRVPGIQQRDVGLDCALVDLIDLKQQGLSEIFVSGWQPRSPLFARLKIDSGSRQIAWGDKHVVMLGADLAKKLEKKVGDEIELYGETFKIVGIYESPLAEENSGVIVGLEDLQRVVDRPDEVSAILITAERPTDEDGLEALRRRIEAVQPGLDVTTVRPSKLDSPAQPPTAERPTPGGSDANSPAKN